MASFSKDELSFVNEIPDQIEIECPVCLHIFTDPHQVSCCGHNFCKSCIERVKHDNGSCPMCKEEAYQSFADKNISRIINGLQVYCTNEVEGCQWKGDLKYLPTHLNKGKREGDCQFEEFKCRYYECQTKGQRQHLNVHEEEWCYQRPYSCEHCYTEVTVNRRGDVVHFYTELGGHHMSAAFLEPRLYLAFHNGKFDKLRAFSQPKILLKYDGIDAQPVQIKSYRK
ncbi:PREDICTED: TNF receptor-associated factor 3-like, partial [Amphimedon queenslandica]|uniref:RING-type domain-containing protein n=1 Tax=Amphimedon queenslandica TaxID=400682 RepID=A0AAN0IRX0_AMPQE